MINNKRDNNFKINWRFLVENSPERIVTVDRNGIILYINKTAPNKTVDDVIGKSVYNLLSTDDQKNLHKILYDIFETGKSHKYISKIIRNDGSEVWYENSLAGIKENGQVITAIINSIDITDLKLYELKLKESEEHYRNLINNLTDVVIEIDYEANISYISPQITQILGYTPDELIGTNGFQFIHPNDLEQIIKKHENAIKTEIPIYYEYKARHKDGYYVPMSLHVNYFKIGDKGKITGILRDDSEKKNTEERQREAEEKYRNIFEKSSNAIALLDMNGKIIECNSATEKVFGYAKEEIVGKNYLNLPFYSESMKITLKERFKKINKGMDIEPQELEIKRKDGKLATIKTTISFVKIGEQDFFQAIIQDITEEKRINENLKESEEKYRNLINNLTDAVVEVDLEGPILYFSPQITRILGYTPDELIGTNGYDLVHPDDYERVIKIIQDSLKTKIPIYFEEKIRHKDGHYVPISIHGNYFKEGDKGKVIGIIRDNSEIKKAEQRLREAEEKYRNIFEKSSNAIVLLDISGRIIDCNSTTVQIIGYVKEELIGKNYLNLPIYSESMKATLKERFKKISRGIDIKPLELEIRRKDGKLATIKTTISFVKIGEQDFFEAIIQDITEQKKAEENLKESEEKFRNIAEQALMGIAIRQEGVIKYCNNRICEINGYSPEEIKSWETNEFIKHIHPEDREYIMEQINKLLVGDLDAVIHDQFRIIRKDGEIRWLETFSKNVIYEGRSADLTMTLDITDKVKAEQNLKESEEKFRTIADQSLIGIDILQDGKEIYVNTALSNIVGYSIEEISNWKPRDFHKLIFPEDLKNVFESIAKIQDGNTGSTIKYSCRIVTKNKKIKWVEIFSKLINFQGKRAVLSSTIDITAKMEAEQKLKEISQMKSELLRRTSHELKTPLVSIKGFSDLLLRLHFDKLDTDIISLIDEIKQGCIRLENLISDILNTSELDLGKVQLKTEMDDLTFLIRFSIKELRGLAEIRRQTINIDIHDNLITRFEKERIHEVLGNLITNAIKYTPPNGRINIKTEIKNGFYIVSVNDNGIGFTKKEISKIFTQFGKIERFGQGLEVISEGSGLGLFISKKIIELHGGEIWVDSEGRNKGSTFYFSLPIIND